MTPPDERTERVLRSCYMGEMPQDPWILIAKALLTAELRDAAVEAYDDAADRICVSCAAAVRARKDEFLKPEANGAD